MSDGKMYYNYRQNDYVIEEAPGAGVFIKDEAGNIYHTYSTYARGLDMFLTAYHYLDLVPKGRDEDGQGMFWVRHHDKYENGAKRTAAKAASPCWGIKKSV
jgi:predicted dithiol-disulfide oxidoreductase (DUF899 family)